jgi:hypothetical protein
VSGIDQMLRRGSDRVNVGRLLKVAAELWRVGLASLGHDARNGYKQTHLHIYTFCRNSLVNYIRLQHALIEFCHSKFICGTVTGLLLTPHTRHSVRGNRSKLLPQRW